MDSPTTAFIPRARPNPTAGTHPQPVAFYSPDTFNFTVLDVCRNGKTLTVKSVGENLPLVPDDDIRWLPPARARLLPDRPGPTLQVDDGFDRAWRRVGLALGQRDAARRHAACRHTLLLMHCSGLARLLILRPVGAHPSTAGR
jgi:hypothetical protein